MVEKEESLQDKGRLKGMNSLKARAVNGTETKKEVLLESRRIVRRSMVCSSMYERAVT